MAAGQQLCEVVLLPGHELRGSPDDLEEFYHSWLVSLRRSASNHTRGVWGAELFRGWNCYKPEFDALDVFSGARSHEQRRAASASFALYSTFMLGLGELFMEVSRRCYRARGACLPAATAAFSASVAACSACRAAVSLSAAACSACRSSRSFAAASASDF